MKSKYITVLSLTLCLSIILSSYLSFSESVFSVSSNITESKYPTIVIDAGHGGEDGGAVSVLGDLEKDINLNICLTLEKLLIQGGYKTKMIRSEDKSIHDETASTTRERKVSDIHNRVNICNSDSNSILVSIHQNHFSESKYFGTQVFYSKNNAQSSILAESIRTAVISLLQPNNTRKCKQSTDVYLLDNITIAGVIVECGFLSNEDEAYLLADKDYCDCMSYSIYLGIIEYIYLNY